MNLRALWLFGLLAICGSCDEIGWTSSDFLAEESRLSNGMRIIVIPDRRWPVVTHMLWYAVGSGDEQNSKTGLAHFLEHLMFKDKDHKEQGGFAQIVSRQGGRDNAFTSYDYTAYFQRIHRSGLELMMRLESDRMRGIQISENDAGKEQQVVIEELHSRMSTNPQALLHKKMRRALYGPDHPYGREVIGYQKDIENLTRRDALDFHRHYYYPRRAVLILAGDIDLDEAQTLAEKYYGSISAGRDETNLDFPPVIKRWSDKTHIVHHGAKTRQAVFSRIYAHANRHVLGGRQSASFEVLAEILSGGQRSRLYRALVIDKKIASFAGANIALSRRGPGEFSLHAWLALHQKQDLKNLKKIEKAIDEILYQIDENPIREAELSRAKERILADIIYRNDSQSHLAHFAGRIAVIGHRLDEITKSSNRIRAVTLEDVQKAAKYMINANRAISGFLLPEKVK